MQKKKCKFFSQCRIPHVLEKSKNSKAERVGKTLTNLSKKNYCFNKEMPLMGCARYRMAKLVGIENVPIGLTPYDHKFVDNVQKAQKYSKNLLI